MWGKTVERENTPLATPRTSSSSFEERTSAPAAAPASPAPKSAAVGKTMRLKGDVYSDEELYLDGEMEGTLEVRHRLTIGPNGKVKANVKARELVVRGLIQGNVDAIDRVVIMNGASIVGDVRTAGIVIEDGAFFKGGIDIVHPEKKLEARTQTAGA